MVRGELAMTKEKKLDRNWKEYNEHLVQLGDIAGCLQHSISPGLARGLGKSISIPAPDYSTLSLKTWATSLVRGSGGEEAEGLSQDPCGEPGSER